MKKIILFTFILCYSAFAQKLNIPEFKDFKLDNGLKVVLVKDSKLPLIQFRLILNGGIRLDPIGYDGLTSITTELMRKGTETKNAKQISEMFESLGSSLSISSSYDYVSMSSEFLKEKFQSGIKIISDLILNPTFPNDEIEKEIKKRIANIDASLEEPRSIITLAFFHKLYENHPYGKFIAGNKSSLEKINRELILNHYKKYFIPNEAIIVIYGDFEEDEMLSTIKENLGNWKKGEQIKFAVSEQSLIKGKNLIIIDKPDVTQTQIRFGNKGIKVNDKDYFALQVANTIFGVGFTSRLMEEIRVKRSLSYGASSSFSSFKEGGSYVVSTFTKNSSVKEVFDVIFDQLKKYREIGPTDKEIEKAKNYIIGDFARDLQSPESLTSQIADLYFYNKDKNFLTNYVQNIRKVPKNEILKVINKYFLIDDLLMMIVSNSKEVKPQLIEFENTQVINYQKIMD